jgi:hypothetical protein
MNVALKEWSAVIRALDCGRQIFLLRKGGIVEARRGFELRYPEFLLFPTFEHQHARHLKAEYRDFMGEPAGTGDSVCISHLARVAGAFRAPRSLAEIAPLAQCHIWNEEFLRQRYAYRPDLPFYLIVVRVYLLSEPSMIPLRPAYAGCKSWVHLTEEISIERTAPVMDDGEFEQRWADLVARISAPSEGFENGKQAAE